MTRAIFDGHVQRIFGQLSITGLRASGNYASGFSIAAPKKKAGPIEIQIVVLAGEYSFVGKWKLRLNGQDIGEFGPRAQQAHATSSTIFTFDTTALSGPNQLTAELVEPASLPIGSDEFIEFSADILPFSISTDVTKLYGIAPVTEPDYFRLNTGPGGGVNIPVVQDPPEAREIKLYSGILSVNNLTIDFLL